jgi:hypothetical protein
MIASYRNNKDRETRRKPMLRSALYPMICMAVSAIVLGQLVVSFNHAMQRTAELPALVMLQSK